MQVERLCLSPRPYIIEKFEHQLSHAEDAPPLAFYLPQRQLCVLSVADGMGSAGRYHVKSSEQPDGQLFTMAYVASRQARRSVIKLIRERYENPELKTPELAQQLGRQLHGDFQTLFSKYVFKNGDSCKKNKPWPMGAEPFPTTLSTLIIEKEQEGGSLIHVLWGGDSPITILTPDKFYTTLAGKSSENKYGIFANRKPSLRYATIHISKDVPFMACATTDGLTTFDSFNFSLELYPPDLYCQLMKEILMETENMSPQDAINKVVTAWADFRDTKRQVYLMPDDTTTAVAFSDLAQLRNVSSQNQWAWFSIDHEQEIFI